MYWGEGSSIRKICCLKGKIQKKTTPVLYLNRQKWKKKNQSIFQTVGRKNRIYLECYFLLKTSHTNFTPIPYYKNIYLLHASKSWGIWIPYYSFLKIESNWTIYRSKYYNWRRHVHLQDVTAKVLSKKVCLGKLLQWTGDSKGWKRLSLFWLRNKHAGYRTLSDF